MSEFDELYEMIQAGASRQEVLEMFGGGTVYVPSLRTYLADVAREQVPEQYNGSNERALSRRFRVSISLIRQIIRDAGLVPEKEDACLKN